MSTRVRSLGFTLVEVILAAAIVGLLVALSIGPVRSGIRNNREKSIRENLQTVWVAANEYFLQHEKTEVTFADLTKPDAGVTRVTSLKNITGENYATVNGGRITRTDRKLELTYDAGRTPRTVVYETGR